MTRKLFAVILCLALLLAFVPTTNPVSAQAPCSGTTHVVQTGENLFRIGLQYNLTATQVAAANGISNINYIQVGQVLCIPAAGQFGTGGPTTTTTTTGVVAGSEIVGGRVTVNSGYFAVDRAANSVQVNVPAGTLDSASGFTTTATIGLDATNNLINVVSGGMPPRTQVSVWVGDGLFNITALAGYLMADNQGVVNGYVEIPFLSQAARQYVVVRGYDGRRTWGYFDLAHRYP